MIDNFKVEDVENFHPISSRIEPLKMFDLDFYPRYNQEGKYAYHFATFENLVAKITGGRFTLENSLHKFVHGNNYTDFTYSEIGIAIERMEDKFKISSKSLKIKRIEGAVNFEDEKQFHNSFRLYGMNEFDKMRSGKTIYGNKFFGSEYNVKGYNKSVETKLHRKFDTLGNQIIAPKNINRFEVEYKKMRPLNRVLTRIIHRV